MRACLLLAFSLPIAGIQGAEKDLAGNWTFLFPRDSREDALWLIRFEQNGGNWSGRVVASRERFPRAELSNLKVKDGKVSFSLTIPTNRYNVQAALPAGDGKAIYGAINLDGTFIPVEMQRTTLTSLNRSVLDREILANSSDRIKIIRSARRLLLQAETVKAKADEVKQWADKAIQAAADYGNGYKREVLLDVVTILNEQDGLASVAIVYAKQADAMVKKTDLPDVQKRTWSLLAVALSRAGKSEEAKEVAGRIDKIDYSVRATPFGGRAGKSTRVALVELFTGTECPPCVAADMAFDGLTKTYKPTDTVLLQYHLHIPGPDPLTNESTVARWKYYTEIFPSRARGTPTILFNGNPAGVGGGRQNVAQSRYQQYVGIVNPLLEKVARANLKATAQRKGDTVTIAIEASEVKDAADTTRLRIALAEEEVGYTGGNKVARHHFVVRDFVGGTEGIAVTKKDLKKELTVDIAALRKKIKAYLDKYNKSGRGPFSTTEWPLEMKKLHVIAFLQDDNSSEVLQAVHAEVK